MKEVLTREHSRAYSLFRVKAWDIFMSSHIVDLFGKDMNKQMMVYRGEELIDIYYPTDFLQEFFGIVNDFAQDKEKVNKVIDEYYEMFNQLKPYFENQKKPENNDDLKDFYELYVKYYSFISVVFVIPNLPSIDEDLKKKALTARATTQEYNESPEDVIKEYLESHYPKLRGVSRLVLPDEVWSEEVNQENYLEKIKARQNGFVFYQGKLHVGKIDSILNELNIELSEGVDQDDIKELKGQTAQKGKVAGKVKIVSSTKELDKVKKGDILVASMTMPKYLPAMKRAAAFVTDEGGITCHAAIVSREMKKPCIIGTKFATRVLKDGVQVEVDANQGIVKIIK